MQSLALRVIGGMTVDADRMMQNLQLTHGALFSQTVLNALVEAGMTRDDAYRIVQRQAQKAWDEGIELRGLLDGDAEVTALLDPEKLDALFDFGRFVRNSGDLFDRLDEIA